MSRLLFVLMSGVFAVGLPASPRLAMAAEIVSNTFNANREGWQVYDYNGGAGGNNVFYPAHWANSGGVGNSGYIWGDDSQWRIDTPENPNSILSFIIYQKWVGGSAIDIRDMTLSVYLRGDNLDLKGASIYFWALSNHGPGTRWHYIAKPLSILQGSWGQRQTFQLINDESLWHRSWSWDPSHPTSLDGVLRNCDSYGFSFVGFSSEVTGRFLMDEFLITTTVPEPGAVDILATVGLARLAAVWRRMCSQCGRMFHHHSIPDSTL